jgi:hypothetical protein
MDVMESVGNFVDKVQHDPNHPCSGLPSEEQDSPSRCNTNTKYQLETFNFTVSKKSKLSRVDCSIPGWPPRRPKKYSVSNPTSAKPVPRQLGKSFQLPHTLMNSSKNMSVKANLSMSKARHGEEMDSW